MGGEYVKHLSARSRIGGHLLQPSFTDLTMWAVLFGNFELARVLWRRSSSPMRTAVLASQLCHDLEHKWPPMSAELSRAAEDMEDWAIGMLNQMHSVEDAVLLLTAVPMRMEGRLGYPPHEDAKKSDQPTRVWQKSVLDQAINRKFPCRRFVAHRHCQMVVDRYVQMPTRIQLNPIRLRTCQL